MNRKSTENIKNIKIILVETSHAGNLGSVARAMKVMGLTQLILVNPKANHLSDEAIAMASHADDILKTATICQDLPQALNGTHLQFALSARTRYYSPPLVYLHDLPVFLKNMDLNFDSNESIALVFGPERTGLSNEDVMQCSHLLNIHTNPDYSSLNLAQAVQLVAYELHRFTHQFINTDINIKDEELNANIIQSRQNSEIELASFEQIQGMQQHLLEALNHLDYKQNPQFAQRLMQLWRKAVLNIEEVNILRGISKLILKNKIIK